VKQYLAGSNPATGTNLEKIVSDLKFNIYAFVKPTTRQEYSALLDEAVRMAEELEQMVDNMSAWLKANAKPL
jgi:hypothetical protein